MGNEGHTYLWHIVHSWDALPDLLLLLPDTVEYGDKLKTWRRVKANLERVGRSAYYADDYTPITGARFALNFLNEVFYGACIRRGEWIHKLGLTNKTFVAGFNFPCVDHRRGGEECVYFGHTGAVGGEWPRLARINPTFPNFLPPPFN